MAYARFGSRSDVYVYNNGRVLMCADCQIGPTFKAKTTDEMVSHLRDHLEAGHKVPEDAFEDLLRDQAENDAQFSQFP